MRLTSENETEKETDEATTNMEDFVFWTCYKSRADAYNKCVTDRGDSYEQ